MELEEAAVLGEESEEKSCGTGRAWRPRETPAFPLTRAAGAPAGAADVVSFDREELRQIFNLYGRKVCAGEWRDYGIAFTPQKAIFSVYRRACEFALYRIEKTPALSRKQGIYSVIAATGLILKRGHDLALVIGVLDKRLRPVPS
jgi:hypothetical protein